MEGLTKLMFAGLGALSMTREKAEKMIDECIHRGQVEKEKRSQLLKDIMDAAEKARKDTEKLVAEQVQRFVTQMNLPTLEDLKRLEEKVDQLLSKG